MIIAMYAGSTNKGVNYCWKAVTWTQQGPELSMTTLTSQESNLYKVYKLHQRYILKCMYVEVSGKEMHLLHFTLILDASSLYLNMSTYC